MSDIATTPYETTDLGVVAFVLYQGHQPSQLRQDGRHMTVFVFGPEARAEVARYYARESVEAMKFVTCMNNARQHNPPYDWSVPTSPELGETKPSRSRLSAPFDRLCSPRHLSHSRHSSVRAGGTDWMSPASTSSAVLPNVTNSASNAG